MLEAASGFALEEITGEVISSQADALAEYAGKTLNKKALGKAIGFIPYLGDVAGFAIEATLDSAQTQEDAAFIKEQFGVLKEADIYGEFDCCANFVQYDVRDNSSQVIWAYPGERTDEIISSKLEKRYEKESNNRDFTEHYLPCGDGSRSDDKH